MAFIAFEGLDGSGKTSLIKGLEEALKTHHVEFITTREPGGTPLAEDIRHLLIRTEGETPVPRAELLLYEAARAQHVDRVIRPALDTGKWVLCDRFTASTVAFQSGGRHLSDPDIHWLNTFATQGLQPDLTVLLDLTVEESARRRDTRVQQTGTAHDRFELEEKAFHERVRNSYLKQAEDKSWLTLSSTQSTPALLAQLIEHLKGASWLES